jgi:hypothetical protein
MDLRSQWRLFRAAISQVRAELSQPDGQRSDWLGWSSNQLSHAFIGSVLAGAAILCGAAPWAAAGITATLYAVLKEVPDWLRSPGWATARDSVQDALFVTGGSVLTVGISEQSIRVFAVALIALLAGLSLGVFQRAVVREQTRKDQ